MGALLYEGYSTERSFDVNRSIGGGKCSRVIDRRALAKEDIHYENIWGLADEDLFTLAIREMDRTYSDHGGKKPFFLHIMTTSNHRPYTYPANRIDIPSGTNREGAVKHTDYAVGDFLRRARAKAWFADTIFVLTADHGASARGSIIPLKKYCITLLIYSPAHIEPKRIERLMSQIGASVENGLSRSGPKMRRFKRALRALKTHPLAQWSAPSHTPVGGHTGVARRSRCSEP
jgi:arylsulfatase A-like enzyme